MKKLYYISVLFSLLLFSCNDSFLDRPPLDELTDANYWQTEQHVINAANACYPGFIGKDIVEVQCKPISNRLTRANCGYWLNISKAFTCIRESAQNDAGCCPSITGRRMSDTCFPIILKANRSSNNAR